MMFLDFYCLYPCTQCSTLIHENIQANPHDNVTTIFALRDIHSIYCNITFKYFIADDAMDSYPTYYLLNHYNLIPFIALYFRTTYF